MPRTARRRRRRASRGGRGKAGIGHGADDRALDRGGDNPLPCRRTHGRAILAKRLTTYILIGLVLGLVVGWLLNARYDLGTPESAAHLKTIAGYFGIVTTIFLRLIKMIIAPLVFTTLVVGIAHMGDTGALGRVGLKSLGWFVCASLMSLTLGLDARPYLSSPGVGLGLPDPAGNRRCGHRQDGFRRRRPGQAYRPAIDLRGDGDQRNPADRDLLGVLRRRDHRRRRARQAAGPRGRGRGRRDAADHRLCHALRTDRGVRGGRRRR